MTRDELARRLAEADKARATIRRATRELRAMGDAAIQRRERGSDRPDDRGDRDR